MPETVNAFMMIAAENQKFLVSALVMGFLMFAAGFIRIFGMNTQ